MIIWEGNKKEFGTSHSGPLIPEGAVLLRKTDGFVEKSLPYGVLPAIICGLTVFLKAFLNKKMPVEPIFLIPAFVIGILVAMPLHEFLHALCYPKGATVWVGLCLRKMAAYAISYDPLSKARFIIMSFAPAFLGIIPLITFIIAPITMKPVLTICMVLSFMGLISPAPDYMDIITVLRKAPKESYICDSPVGLYACIQGSEHEGE